MEGDESVQALTASVALSRSSRAPAAPCDSSYAGLSEGELRRLLVLAMDAASSPVPASTGAQSRYVVEQMSEGFWDGMFRVRCGFRVIGLFDSEQEAWDHACLDFAAAQRRIGPAAGV